MDHRRSAEDDVGAGARRVTGRAGALALLVAAALVGLGHALIVERTIDAANETLRVRADALQYLALARHETGVPPPFRFRVVVPWLAGLWPGREMLAFRAVAYLSMGLVYALIPVLARRAGASRLAAVTGLLLVFASPWNLYVFHNPVMTDAAAHLVIAAEIGALALNLTLPFALLVLLGSGVRETTGALAPALWATGHRRAAVLLTATLLAALVAIRATASPGGRIVDALGAGLAPEVLLHRARAAGLTWGGLWVLLPLGLVRAHRDTRTWLWPASAWLLAGACASALVAADTGRMLAILLVPMALCAALAIDGLPRRTRPPLVATLLLGALLNAVAWMPNRVLPLDGGPFQDRNLRLAAVAASVLPAIAVVVASRRRRRGRGADARESAPAR